MLACQASPRSDSPAASRYWRLPAASIIRRQAASPRSKSERSGPACQAGIVACRATRSLAEGDTPPVRMPSGAAPAASRVLSAAGRRLPSCISGREGGVAGRFGDGTP